MKDEDILFKAFQKVNMLIGNEELLEQNAFHPIIFSHEFAKKFWGEKDICFEPMEDKRMHVAYCVPIVGTIGFAMPTWQYHLQQMVLEEQPLKYLEKFLC